MCRTTLSIAGTAAVLSIGAPATAQDGPPSLSFGLFASFGNSPYVGEDSSVGIVPNVQFTGERLSIGLNGLSYTLLDDGANRIDALVSPRFSALNDPDSAALAGIDRDLTADIGLRYVSTSPQGVQFSATLLQEVTGEHDGRELDLRAAQSLHDQGMPLSAYVGATWQSAGLSQYLYGVLPGEARIGRPAYDPGSTITPYLGLSAALPLSETMSLVGGVQATFLGDAITDSPIVDESFTYSASVGLNFRF